MSTTIEGSGLHDRMVAVVGQRTFRHVGKLTDTHHETVRRYLSGQAPSVEFIAQLAASLGINGHWLLTGQGPMRSSEVRAHALKQADASELLSAMAATIESLADRLDRIERFVQTMEVRLRAARSGAGGNEDGQKERSSDERAHGGEAASPAARIGRAVAKRLAPDAD